MISLATETRSVVMDIDGPQAGEPSIFPPPDEWSADPANGVPGNSLEDFEASIFASLFTDRRVELSELAPGSTDQKGYWGDTFPETEGDEWGGRLHLADRARIVAEGGAAGSLTIETIARHAQTSVDWLVADRILTKIEASAELVDRNRVDILIVMTRKPGDTPETLRYGITWG